MNITERFNSFYYTRSELSIEFDATNTFRVDATMSDVAREALQSLAEIHPTLSVPMVLGSIFTAGLLPLILFLVALIQGLTETKEEFTIPFDDQF